MPRQPDRSVAVPEISSPLLRAFLLYVKWYVYRNFHAVRISKAGNLSLPEGMPAIVCMNHPSWWDPLMALLLAYRYFPSRQHFGPIDSAALGKYSFFGKLGFFGIDPGTSAGASRFLHAGRAILASPQNALWVTAQGTFIDARVRPTQLRGGVGHLVRRLPAVAVIPLAVEYPFWEERYPEALARFGAPIEIKEGRLRSSDEWTAEIASALQRTQDDLAREALARRPDAFDVVLGGKVGIGGIYDAWRRLKARTRGERFQGAHGAERL